MIRNVVVDTNCLLRMIPIHGKYRQVWEAFLDGQYCICVTNDIISEYLEILSQKVTPSFGRNIIEAILNSPYCLRFDPQFRFNLIKQDTDDNKFVDCAVIANAEYLVTDDHHFDVLKQIDFPHVDVIGLDDFAKTTLNIQH